VAIAIPAVAVAAVPHAPFGADTALCGECHSSHGAGSARGLLRDRGDSGQQVTQVGLCYTCHDGGAATNVKTGSASFGSASGHSVEERGTDDPGRDLTDECSDCHYPHEDPATLPRIPRSEINGVPVSEAGTGWCLACHDDSQSWYVSLTATPYPALSSPLEGDDGYPVLGRFPGASVYSDAGLNAHVSIPASMAPDPIVPGMETTRSAGDCLYCHSAHRGASVYDSLVATYSTPAAALADTVDGDYAAVCFRCHADSSEAEILFAGIPDIKSLATGDAVDSGHTIRSGGAAYEPGAPLPCYECHNPHGSSRNNTMNVSDALGQNLDPRDPADTANVGASKEKVRQFCFSCHVTHDADPGTGRPWAWDSASGAYVAVGIADTAVDLPRNVAVGTNDLRLPMATGHEKADVDRACYECHGDVHRPMSGVSEGGVTCSTCHSALNGMVGDTTRYHHVLDDPNWDQAPGTGGAYPTSTSSLACVSCHVDHSEYESLPGSDPLRADGKGYSLRSSAIVAYPAASNTDDTLCLSCHSVEVARNTGGQKANAIQETLVWKIDSSLWAVSPHNYDSPGPFNDGSTFYANCAKCHGNLQGTLSSGKFSVHFSAEQRLLNALGDTVAINLAINEEQMCFRCHSVAADFAVNGGTLPGVPKPSDSVDWYGTQPMSTSNIVIYAQMDPTINEHGHKPADYQSVHLLSDTDETQAYISANKHVECADCHNHHVVGDARHEWGTSNLVSEAIRGVSGQEFSPAALTTLSTVNRPTDAQVNAGLTWMGAANGYATREHAICFKCHSSENTALASWGGTKSGAVTTNRWTNVAAEVSVGNQSRHPVIAPNDAYPDTTTYGTSRVAAGQLSGIWEPGDTMYCSDCHGDSTAPLAGDPGNLDHAQGPHGSSVQYSLRGPNTAWPANSAGTLWTIDMVETASGTPGAEMPFCANCHENIKGNQAHIKNAKHQSGPCIQCHILIPHGGGMSRLIGDGNGSMPARYAYDNDKSTIKVASYRKQANPLNYSVADCSVTDSGCVAGKTSHAVGDITSPGYENW
jgi:predicted CXXCH cytochrome family protein